MTIKAHGKIILLGEHAVVHGHPALAGAIDRGVTITATPSDRLRLVMPDWNLDVDAGPVEGASRSDSNDPIARALRAVAAATGHAGGARLDGVADLPPASGLGSSAAVSVAVARALAPDAPVEAVIAAAMAGERCFHGNPSGIDVELAARGGLGLYRRGVGLTPLAAPPVPVVVAVSGEARSTAAMVARVADALATDPAATAARLDRLGQAARVGADAAVAGDLVRLGGLFDETQQLLAELGLSTPVLDALIDDARAAGAAGAKLTGAGGGGAVVAVAPGREDEVLTAWRTRGKVAFACLVGALPAAERPLPS
jgi:mevalonate kinase